MTSLLTSFYFLNFKDAEVTCSADVDCINVSSKSGSIHGSYSKEKCDFFRSRTSKIKKHWGWKRNIKSVDRLFRSYQCVSLSFDFDQPLKLFFTNGTILTVEFSSDNSTVEKIEISNNLTGKLLPSRIVDAVFCQNSVYVTYCEPKLSVIQVNPENSSRLFGIKEKLIGSEFKISHTDIVGPSSKSIERKLSLSSSHDHLLVWWKFNIDDVLPWTPITFSADRINMVIYTLSDGFELLCTVKAHGNLIQANYSKQYSNQILTLEKVKEDPGDVNICVYEIIGDQYNHTYLSKLPLQGVLLSCDWSSNEKLLVSDSENLLLMYDLRKKTSIVTNLLYPPKQISWHPNNCIALVVGSDNQLQCFDAALNCVKFQLFYNPFQEHNLLNLNSYFPHCCSIQKILWQKSAQRNSCIFLLDSDVSSILTVNFCSGILTQNNLGITEFVSQYLKSNSIDEAILLMRSLSWNHESELSFQCLSKITNYLLRKPLNSQILQSLELALGTFYDQVDILSKHVIKNYQYKANHLARRFFHHLLRHFQFRKAFLLAIDLDSQDLFLDLYHMAKKCGEDLLATVALRKAEEFKTSSSSCSSISASSFSESETSSDEEVTNFFNSSNSNSLCTNYNISSQVQYGLPITTQSQYSNNWLLTTNDLVEISKNIYPDQSYFTSARGSTYSELDSSSHVMTSEVEFKKLHEENDKISFSSNSISKFSENLTNDSQIVNFEKPIPSKQNSPVDDELNVEKGTISKLLPELLPNYPRPKIYSSQNTLPFGNFENIHKKIENITSNSRDINIVKCKKYNLRPSEQSDLFQRTFEELTRENSSAVLYKPPIVSISSQHTSNSNAFNINNTNVDSFVTNNGESPVSFTPEVDSLNKSSQFLKTPSAKYRLQKMLGDTQMRNYSPLLEPTPLSLHTSKFQIDSLANDISMPFTAFSRFRETPTENPEQKRTMRTTEIRVNKTSTEEIPIDIHKSRVKRRATISTSLEKKTAISRVSNNYFSSALISKIDGTDNVLQSHPLKNMMSVTSKISNNDHEFDELEDTKIKLEHFGIV